MSGRSVSGYVDEAVVERLGAVSRHEGRTIASLVGQALIFYAPLPEVARTALRRINQLGTSQERDRFAADLTRTILKADMAMTQRLMAEDIGTALPTLANEGEIEAAAVDWSHRES